LVYAREYPDVRSTIQDTIWAGDNVLDNPSMEEAQEINERYEVWADATGGTFTLTVMGQTTAAIDWDASVVQMEERLQDLSNVDDVVVSAGDNPGTEDDPWQIEFIIPAVVDPNMSVDDTLLTGLTGQVTITTVQEGRDDVPLHWTVSQYADRRSDPRFHGTYASDGFRRDNTVAHSGVYSLRINPLTRYGGAQQVVRVEPGMTYQASIWVYTTDATEVFKFIARSAYVDGEAPGLAQDGGSIPASTWTQFSFELFVPYNVDTVIFRIAAVGNDNPIPFWVDAGELLEGFAAATPGEILGILMDDAAVDHVADPRGAMLDWIDYSGFSPTLDSNGDAWDFTMSFIAQFGETYGQVLDKFVNRGVEWWLIPKPAPVGGKTHELHLYNKGGRDSTPSTAITIRQGVLGGEIVDRIPDYTALLVEGESTYYEAEDGSAAFFGRLEKFIAARDTADNDTLQVLADEAFASEVVNRRAARFTIVETLHHPRPGKNYNVGDTIPMQAPPSLMREYRRVQTFDYVNTRQTSYAVTGSTIYGGEAAAYELVRRLWRRFQRPETPRRRGAVPLSAKGGQPTFVIAASDSNQADKDKADAVAIGAADHVLIQSYLNSLAGTKGLLILTDGTFVTGAKLLVPERVILRGHGSGTFISANVANDWAIEGAASSIIEDMDVSNPSGSGVRLWELSG
jgi:hypothetical protein